MKKTNVRPGQTWADLAVEHYGTVEAVFDLAAANGAAVSDTPAAGMQIVLPPTANYPAVVRELKQRDAHPGTAYDQDNRRLGVFSLQFTAQFT